MPLRLVIAPTGNPVTLAEAKVHLRVSAAADDADITAMVTAATGQLDGRDGILGRALVTQQWQLLLDCFPGASVIKMPLPPLQSVESITYVDAAGATQTLPTSVYAVDTASEPGVVSLKFAQVWPSTRTERNAVTIAFTAGYGVASMVPERLKSAIKLMVGDLYENREAAIVGVPRADNPAVANLLFPFRVF